MVRHQLDPLEAAANAYADWLATRWAGRSSGEIAAAALIFAQEWRRLTEDQQVVLSADFCLDGVNMIEEALQFES